MAQMDFLPIPSLYCLYFDAQCKGEPEFVRYFFLSATKAMNITFDPEVKASDAA